MPDDDRGLHRSGAGGDHQHEPDEAEEEREVRLVVRLAVEAGEQPAAEAGDAGADTKATSRAGWVDADRAAAVRCLADASRNRPVVPRG